MKKLNLLLLLLFVPFFINAYIYSFSNLRNYYTLGASEKDKDDAMDDITVILLTSSDRAKAAMSTTSSSFISIKDKKSPINISKNDFFLKISILMDEKVNFKIMDANGSPAYLRQYTPDYSNNELMIDIADWYSGKYSIVFTNSTGRIIAAGEFKIY